MKNKDIIDHVKTRQMLDYYLLEELVRDLPRGYSIRTQGKISQHHNLPVPSQNIIRQHARGIMNGHVALQPAADMDGTPTFRLGKDRCYEGLWTLVDILIPNTTQRKYVGLAANQITTIHKRLNSANPITVIEFNKEKVIRLKKLAQLTTKLHPNTQINIVNADIFEYLNKDAATNKFNIFDLDLMCAMPKWKEIDKWVSALWNSSSYGTNIFYIACCVGRNISEAKHDARIEFLLNLLADVGFENINHSTFNYRDRVIPMKGERIVGEKHE